MSFDAVEVGWPSAINESPVDFFNAASGEDFAELSFVAAGFTEEDDSAGKAIEAMAAVGGLAGVALSLLFEIVLTMGPSFGEETGGFVEGEKSLVFKENGGCGSHKR